MKRPSLVEIALGGMFVGDSLRGWEGEGGIEIEEIEGR